jgi:arginine decarboxylase-like protein
MSSIINFSLKNADGSYSNYTMSVNDTQDKFGNNVAITIAQSKEEREAKKPKVYLGNGKVTWTDGKIVKAEYVEKTTTNITDRFKDDLPF